MFYLLCFTFVFLLLCEVAFATKHKSRLRGKIPIIFLYSLRNLRNQRLNFFLLSVFICIHRWPNSRNEFIGLDRWRPPAWNRW